MALVSNARGRYFGGIANAAQTDVFDVPEHDSTFDEVAKAADREMIAVLANDLDVRRITEAAVRGFVMLTEDES